MREPVAELYKLNRHGKCRACGTALPESDLILQKFCRCYYCGRHNPLRPDWWRSLATPALAGTAAVLTLLWSRTFS